MEDLGKDFDRTLELCIKIRDNAFLLKQSHQKITKDELEKNLINLVNYTNILENHYLSMKNKYDIQNSQVKIKPKKPEFNAVKNLADQKRMELLY